MWKTAEWQKQLIFHELFSCIPGPLCCIFVKVFVKQKLILVHYGYTSLLLIMKTEGQNQLVENS